MGYVSDYPVANYTILGKKFSLTLSNGGADFQ